MCECHSIPCWSFVDSPGSQCAGECHNNHYRVKQYDSNRTNVTDWIRQSTMWYWISLSRALQLMDHWAYLTWAYIELTLWKCGMKWWFHNCLKPRLPVKVFVAHTSHRNKPWARTSSSTMVLTPRMPRTATSRLWSVTAYARNSRRPTDTGSILHFEKRCPTLNADKR